MTISPVKLLVCAESGSGKTGALASLAAAGYNLRVLDLDNNSSILRNMLTKPNSPYVKANAEVGKFLQSCVSISEPRVAKGGKLLMSKAFVWSKVGDMLADWQDGELKLGSITTWGDRDVLVVDTFTRLCRSAMNFHLMMNGRLNQHPTLYDYGDVGTLVRAFLEIVSDPEVKCNVILNCHIDNIESKETGLSTDYPKSIGKALSPDVGTYFGTLLKIAKIKRDGVMRQVFQTVPNGTLGIKTTAPFDVQAEYPLESGLAQYFAAVRGE